MNLIRPTRPTSENHVGRPQTVGGRGSSDTSDTKNSKAKLNRERYAPAAAPTPPSVAPVDPFNEYADFMPPAPPLGCFTCSCWQKVPDLAYWCGRCVVTGRKINMQSRCDRGLEEWQSSPLPERTAPQPGGRRARHS